MRIQHLEAMLTDDFCATLSTAALALHHMTCQPQISQGEASSSKQAVQYSEADAKKERTSQRCSVRDHAEIEW